MTPGLRLQESQGAMSKKTTLQMTVGDESSGSCSSQVAERPRGRKAGKMVVAELPRCSVQVDNRDPCRSRMVLTTEDLSISMEQSTCPAAHPRGSSVTTLCVQTARARDGCPHRPPRTVLETQIVVRK